MAKKKTTRKTKAAKKSAAKKATSKTKAARAKSAKKKTTKKVAKAKSVASKKAVKKKAATKKKVVKKAAAKKKSTTKKATVKKATVKKSAAKKSTTKKPVAKKTSAKKAVTQKAPPKKPASNKTPPRKVNPPAASNKSPFVFTPKREEQVLDVSPAAKPCTTSAEAGLNARDLDHFRKLLMDKRAELRGDVSALKSQAFGSSEQVGDESRMPLHMADLGSDNFEHELTLALVEGEQVILREIEEALERIDKRTFGICLATGRPVGKKRLSAKPWAKYCYEYTLAQERGRR